MKLIQGLLNLQGNPISIPTMFMEHGFLVWLCQLGFLALWKVLEFVRISIFDICDWWWDSYPDVSPEFSCTFVFSWDHSMNLLGSSDFNYWQCPLFCLVFKIVIIKCLHFYPSISIKIAWILKQCQMSLRNKVLLTSLTLHVCDMLCNRTVLSCFVFIFLLILHTPLSHLVLFKFTSQISGSLARKAIKELMARGLIRMVSAHASQQIYTRATNT